MGCQVMLGDCRKCGIRCSSYGRHAEALCDYRYEGGACICDFPCNPPPNL